jgi:hypothetical protein
MRLMRAWLHSSMFLYLDVWSGDLVLYANKKLNKYRRIPTLQFTTAHDSGVEDIRRQCVLLDYHAYI